MEHISQRKDYIPSLYIYILYCVSCKKPFPLLGRMCSFRSSSSYGSVIHKLPIFPIPIHSSTTPPFVLPSILFPDPFCPALSCPVLSPPSPNACWLFVSCIFVRRSWSFVRGVYPFLSMECHLKSFSIIGHKLEYYNIRISKGCEMNERY